MRMELRASIQIRRASIGGFFDCSRRAPRPHPYQMIGTAAILQALIHGAPGGAR